MEAELSSLALAFPDIKIVAPPGTRSFAGNDKAIGENKDIAIVDDGTCRMLTHVKRKKKGKDKTE